MSTLLGWLDAHLARFLAREVHVHCAAPATWADRLLATLRPGDVLLVEGHSRVSSAIKYMTHPPGHMRRCTWARPWPMRVKTLNTVCSTLIAQAFQSIRYPILPITDIQSDDRPDCPACANEILRVRHHSLFAPRDFDVSPYFAVIKPTIEAGLDFHDLKWSDRPSLAKEMQAMVQCLLPRRLTGKTFWATISCPSHHGLHQNPWRRRAWLFQETALAN